MLFTPRHGRSERSIITFYYFFRRASAANNLHTIQFYMCVYYVYNYIRLPAVTTEVVVVR